MNFLLATKDKKPCYVKSIFGICVCLSGQERETLRDEIQCLYIVYHHYHTFKAREQYSIILCFNTNLWYNYNQTSRVLIS